MQRCLNENALKGGKLFHILVCSFEDLGTIRHSYVQNYTNTHHWHECHVTFGLLMTSWKCSFPRVE